MPGVLLGALVVTALGAALVTAVEVAGALGLLGLSPVAPGGLWLEGVPGLTPRRPATQAAAAGLQDCATLNHA